MLLAGGFDLGRLGLEDGKAHGGLGHELQHAIEDGLVRVGEFLRAVRGGELEGPARDVFGIANAGRAAILRQAGDLLGRSEGEVIPHQPDDFILVGRGQYKITPILRRSVGSFPSLVYVRFRLHEDSALWRPASRVHCPGPEPELVSAESYATVS